MPDMVVACHPGPAACRATAATGHPCLPGRLALNPSAPQHHAHTIMPGPCSGLARVTSGRLVGVKKYAGLLERPLELWARMFEAFPRLGVALCVSGWGESLLGIEDCDVLIGIFWKRFGTPVPDAGSGTEHEFRKAYEAWQRQQRPAIMMYFNQKPWTPSTTEETTEWGLRLVRGFLRQNVPLPAQEPANQAQAHGGDRGPLTAPAGVEEILGHFDELRRAYARIPSWSRGMADLWRIESLSYRSTVPAIRAGLEKLKRM